MNTMQYKGYAARIEYSDEDDCFDGHGAIKLLDHHSEYPAILLKQAIPGNSLKENCPIDAEKIIISYAQVVKAIASQKLPNYTYVQLFV